MCILCDLSCSDTFSAPTLLNPTESNPSQEYVFSSTGIAWPGESKKYVSNPVPGGYSSYTDIKPPPNWALRFPNGYTNSTPPPDLKNDEHFQNWMRTAGLPTFTKLYGRNDADTMQKGRYRIVIGMSKILQRNASLVLTVFVQTSLSYLTKGLSHLLSQPCRGSEGRIPSSDGHTSRRRPSSSSWQFWVQHDTLLSQGLWITVISLVNDINLHDKFRRLGDMSLLSWNR